jgi:hypothetical protein
MAASLSNLTLEQAKVIVEQFQGMYDLEDKMDALKEDMKSFKAGIKDTTDAIAKEYEIGKRSVKSTYERWKFRIQNGECADEIDILENKIMETQNVEPKTE